MASPALRVAFVLFTLAVVVLGLRACIAADESPAAVTAAAVGPALPVEVAPSKADVRHACWDAIIASSAIPASVSFHSFTAPPVVNQLPDGRFEVFAKFSAKNAFNTESTMIGRCVIQGDGKTVQEVTAQQSR